MTAIPPRNAEHFTHLSYRAIAAAIFTQAAIVISRAYNTLIARIFNAAGGLHGATEEEMRIDSHDIAIFHFFIIGTPATAIRNYHEGCSPH